MASNKLRNVGITQGNRQKLPLNSTFRRSTSDDQTARTNLKRKTVESSQVNEDMDDRSRIFRPWQSLSEPLDSVGDEIDEDEIDLIDDGSIAVEKKNLTWSDEMDVVLVDGLIDQMEKGQKIGSTYTPTAYAAVAELVRVKCKKLGVSSSHVKHRIKTLKKTYAAAQKVVSQSGFGFNESTQMVEAEPRVWTAYLLANPDAKSFRYKPVLNYYKMDLLFGKDRATGSGAVGPKERNLQSTKETGGSTEDISLPTNEESSSAFQVKDQVESKKRKGRAKEFVSEELKSLKSGMEAVAKALERGNLRNYTEEQLYEEISKVGSLSEVAEMKVYQALTADPNSARAFIACPITRRELWLKVKFGDEFLI